MAVLGSDYIILGTALIETQALSGARGAVRAILHKSSTPAPWQACNELLLRAFAGVMGLSVALQIRQVCSLCRG